MPNKTKKIKKTPGNKKTQKKQKKQVDFHAVPFKIDGIIIKGKDDKKVRILQRKTPKGGPITRKLNRKRDFWKEEDIKHTNDNIDNMVVDFEALFNEALNASNEDFITESGDVEKWVGSNKNKMLESKQETIDYLKSLKK